MAGLAFATQVSIRYTTIISTAIERKLRKMSRGILFPLAALVCSVAFASTPPPTWEQGFDIGVGCNDPVLTTARLSDGRYLVGGAFSNCGSVAVSGLAVFDPASETWSAFDPPPPAGAAYPTSVQVFGEDVLIVSGGVFHWDGTVWNGFDADNDQEIFAATMLNDQVYVAGYFWAPGGVGISGFHVARWSGAAWNPLLASSDDWGFDEQFTSLTVYRGELHVGGYFREFSNASGSNVSRIARWDGSSWQPVGSDGGDGVRGPTPGVVAAIHAMAVWDDALYVTGSFTEANGGGSSGAVSASRIARWDGTQWTALGSGLQGGSAWALSGSAAGLVVGGNFTQAGSVTVRGLARWNGTQWQELPGAPSYRRDEILSLSEGSQGVVVGGRFGIVDAAGSAPIVVNHVAEWNGAEWSKFGDDYGDGINGPVTAIGTFRGDIVVGGAFTSAGGSAASNIARWDGSQWHALGSPSSNGFDDYVHTLETMDNRLVIGGQFEQARNADGPLPAHLIAVWDGDALSALGDDIPGGGQVNDLLWSPPDLYAGGFLGTQDPADPHGVARWDGTQWSALGTAPGPGLIGGVNAIAIVDGELHGGGYFGAARGVDGILKSLNKLARWDGMEWLGVGVGEGNGVGHTFQSQFAIHAIVPEGRGMYVAGGFDLVNPVPPGIIEQRTIAAKRLQTAPLGTPDTVSARGIVRWTGEAWETLGGIGAGPTDTVRAVSATRNGVFVGGDFSSIRVPPDTLVAKSLARWHLGSWTDVGADLTGLRATVAAIRADDRRGMYIGGSFGSAGGAPASHFTYYDAQPDTIFVSDFER